VAKGGERVKIMRKTNTKKYIDGIGNGYVKAILKAKGFSIETINQYPELIELNREIIKSTRLCRTLQTLETTC